MKLFDPQCYTLASHFLDDCANVIEADRKDLASAIQQCIEDWLEERDSEIAEATHDAHIDSQIAERRIEGKQAAHERD